MNWLQKLKTIEEPAEMAPLAKENRWIFDFLVEFLCSDLWKNRVNEFIDLNCILFTDTEENQIQHLRLHKEFVKIVCGLYDAVIEQLGIDEELCAEMIRRGLLHPKYKRIFEQLIIAGDFLKFKKLMINRNIALNEISAKIDQISPAAVSKLSEEELLRLAMQESMLLQKARRQSEEEEVLRMVQEFEMKESKAKEQYFKIQESEVKHKQSLASLSSLPPLSVKVKEYVPASSDKSLVEEAAELKPVETAEEHRQRLLARRVDMLAKLRQKQKKEEKDEPAFVVMEPGLSEDQRAEQQERKTKLMRKIKAQLEDDL